MCVDRLWKEVTYHLKHKNVEEATNHKRRLEQDQRDAAQKRKETGAKIQHKVCVAIARHFLL